MLIFARQRLVFLATPKAGSSAVEAALEPLAEVAIKRPAPLKHMTARDYGTHFAPYLEAKLGGPLTTVALMREPLDWLRSWYRFQLQDDIDDPGHPMAGRSFEQFAQDFMAPRPPSFANPGSQTDFLCDAAGAPLVDHLFRYEEIDSFVEFLEDKLDFEIILPRVNVPPAVDVELSAQTSAALQEAMAAELSLYATLV